MSELNFRISKQLSIKEMQDQFSRSFPFLKINFFKNRKPGPEASGPQVILFSSELLLKNINPKMNDGELTIPESMTVFEMGNGFDEKFGLSIQILRKSGNLWLDTARTNYWTLKEQNDHGREISPERIGNSGIIRGPGFPRTLG